MEKIKPFIKWVGGKSQLLNEIDKRTPNKDKYFELFVGGGAPLFHFLSNNKFKEYYINDLNPKLINVYATIKHDKDVLLNCLDNLSLVYNNLANLQEKKDFFIIKRKEFNNLGIGTNQAALFIFLNKTCFNGLYRVNKKGEFNSTFGNKENFSYDKTNLNKVSDNLQNVKMFCGDYKSLFNLIDNNSFVYLDPPYKPITKSVISYNSSGFNDKEQIELKDFCDKINNKGAKFLLSNSDDLFFDNIYSNYKIDRVKASRNINRTGIGNTSINEIMVYNP